MIGWRRTAALLVGLVTAWLLAAPLAAFEVPRWDPQADPAHGLDWPVVILPGDHDAAVRLLHAWNAIAPSLPGPGPGEGAGLAVPSLVQLLGAEGQDGADPDPAESIQGWRPATFGVFDRSDRTTAEALAFPLRSWREAGIHVLQVPSEAHRQRIQAFVDGTWLAAGHPAPPRARPDSASPTSQPAISIWGTVAGGVALLLLVIAIAWWSRRRRA